MRLEKLTSRKFWLALANFVAMMIIAGNGSYETATHVTSMIMAGGGIIAYVFCEAWCDAKKG